MLLGTTVSLLDQAMQGKRMKNKCKKHKINILLKIPELGYTRKIQQ